MNEQLLDSFRHNSWATQQLVNFCRPLTEEQLTTSGVGTFGGILATLNHIITCDGSLRPPACPRRSGVGGR